MDDIVSGILRGSHDIRINRCGVVKATPTIDLHVALKMNVARGQDGAVKVTGQTLRPDQGLEPMNSPARTAFHYNVATTGRHAEEPRGTVSGFQPQQIVHALLRAEAV